MSDQKGKESKPEPSTSNHSTISVDSGGASSTNSKPDNAEDVSNRTPYTRAARRLKNTKPSGELEPREEFVELKEPVKPKRATMTNTNDQRGIQIGKAYQAPAVPLLSSVLVTDDDDRDVPVWHYDTEKVTEATLDQFIDEAVGVYRLSLDRALYILFTADYDIPKAREEVQARKIVDEDWNDDDKILFRLAFQQYGKNFNKIKQIMPYRTICNIIQYYYHVKKRWKDSSHLQTLEGVEMLSNAGDENLRQSKNQELIGNHKKPSWFNALQELPSVEVLVDEKNFEGICANCGQESKHIQRTDTKDIVYFAGNIETELDMCLLCRQYYQRCGSLRPADRVSTLTHTLMRNHGRLDPIWRSMVENFEEDSLVIQRNEQQVSKADSFDISASGKCITNLDIKVKNMEEKITKKMGCCMQRESDLEKEFAKCKDHTEMKQKAKEYRIKDKAGRRRDKWTDIEKFVATQAIYRYDKDWDIIMTVLPTKTREQLFDFYIENKAKIEELGREQKNVKVIDTDMPTLEPA